MDKADRPFWPLRTEQVTIREKRAGEWDRDGDLVDTEHWVTALER